MPIYEYRCKACGATTEELMRLSDPDPVICPACQQPELTRFLSAPSFRLGGSGWYETDFKGEKDVKRNIAGDTAPAESKSESTTEAAKPAAAADKPASAPAPAPAPAAPAKIESPKTGS